MSNYEPVSTSSIDVVTNRFKRPGLPDQVIWNFSAFKTNGAQTYTETWILDRPFLLQSIDSMHFSTYPITSNLLTEVWVEIRGPTDPTGYKIYQQSQVEGPQRFDGVAPTQDVVPTQDMLKKTFNLVLDTGTEMKIVFFNAPVNVVSNGAIVANIYGYYLPGMTQINA